MPGIAEPLHEVVEEVLVKQEPDGAAGRPSSTSGGAGPVDTGLEGGASVRTYSVRTLGCQMNVHDSERIAGLLEADGYRAAGAQESADVVVINTCAVRENADNRLYGNLGHLASVKRARPGMQIAVGGCLAQKDRAGIVERAPWVDVVFGTHNLDALPVLLRRAAFTGASQVEIAESLQVFPSALPSKRESVFAAWVAISVGCSNTCTFCIVPSLRGEQRDRPLGEIVSEVESLVAMGTIEVTLLGQNVNAYGRHRGGSPSFSDLLRACGAVRGLERLRFTSPHPRDFTDDVIEAMATTRAVMPSLHMPLQSGSDRVLRAMRRSYRQDRYLDILHRVRRSIPEAAVTTDIIVGFPGETEEDFQATLDVVRRAGFSSAFTFKYSPRPGTPAAGMADQVPQSVVADRYERLVREVEDTAWAQNRRQVGATVEVLVAEGEGRKDQATSRRSGRARDGRLVHFEGAQTARPGDCVLVDVVSAAPHHLLGRASAVRSTPAGDAWERANIGCAPPAAPTVGGGRPLASAATDGEHAGRVSLGMPSLRSGM